MSAKRMRLEDAMTSSASAAAAAASPYAFAPAPTAILPPSASAASSSQLTDDGLEALGLAQEQARRREVN